MTLTIIHNGSTHCEHQTRPLPGIHPEFSVLHWPGFTEYRVEHWRLAFDGSGAVVHGTCVWSWLDVVVLALVDIFVERSEVPVSRPVLAGVWIVVASLVWMRFTQVLHESLLVLPMLGIQLETHRGHPLLPTLFTSRHFIPLSALQDVVIHEGFRRRDVWCSLVALQRPPGPLPSAVGAATTGTGAAAAAGRTETQVHVAFKNILPYFPVLKHVYLSVQETLFARRPDGWINEYPVDDDDGRQVPIHRGYAPYTTAPLVYRGPWTG